MNTIEQLEQTEQPALPQVIETLKETPEELVTINHTTGTIRTDLRGGPLPEELNKPTPKEPEVSFIDKPIDPATGVSLVSNDESKRVVDLGNGTVRTDLR